MRYHYIATIAKTIDNSLIVGPYRQTIADLQKLIEDLRRQGEQNGASQEELVREIYMHTVQPLKIQ